MDMVTEEVKPKKKIAKRQSRFKQALSGFNRKYIDEAVKFYLDRGIDPMIISGIFGNISKESDWNPLANSKDNGLGDFYGLVLMSPDMRKEVKRVYGKVDANTTHLFIYDSMTGNKKISPAWRSYMKDYGGYWNNKYNDPETAAMAFGTVFERPSEKYADWGERMRSARDAYDHIISITNALKNAKAKSFGNPVKTTVTADGNKVMTINPKYWELQGMLKPVLTELPVQLSVITVPAKKVVPRIEDVALAPWDLNQQILNQGIEVKPNKSPFSLDLSLPSLDSLLLINSPLRLMEQYFADALGISDMLPLAPSLFPKLKDGKVPNDPYERFKYSLPDNQKNTPESEYNTRRYWELNGRPKSFQEAVEREMYDLLEDGWHANSVSYNLDTGEYEFMKPRNHPTVHKELEWYNSDDAKEFRKKYKHIQPKDSNFDKYVPRLKNGKLPRYGDGTRLVVGDDGWNRITDSDVANLMENWVATPYGIRNKFDYEYNPNYKQPIGKNAAVRQDNNAWTRQRVAEESNKRSWLSDAADVSHAIGEGAMLASTFAAPEVEPLVYPAYLATKNAVLSALTSNTPVMLYVRYPLGKVIYGIDALFPTLYRKIKSMPTEPVNGTIQISNPGNRFVFSNTKKESPIITNFTYDAPVRKHASGNWDSGFTLAMPGRKTLLGKNVISTEPSDLFTYGDDIKIPLKDVTLISGDLDEIALANKYRYKVATSPKLLQLYLEGDSPGILFTSNGGRKLSLRKQELSAYAKEIENTTRLLFRSPTKNDVDFMNFVLLPKIKGNVYDPSMLDYLINNGIGTFGDRIGNAELRSYLLDPDRWRNILYDPATHAESLFRNLMGIDLKRRYKDGKSPIHIKPANKGKLTRLKKRTGKSESELYNDGNPVHRKMVVFARNARKWKH